MQSISKTARRQSLFLVNLLLIALLIMLFSVLPLKVLMKLQLYWKLLES